MKSKDKRAVDSISQRSTNRSAIHFFPPSSIHRGHQHQKQHGLSDRLKPCMTEEVCRSTKFPFAVSSQLRCQIRGLVNIREVSRRYSEINYPCTTGNASKIKLIDSNKYYCKIIIVLYQYYQHSLTRGILWSAVSIRVRNFLPLTVRRGPWNCCRPSP